MGTSNSEDAREVLRSNLWPTGTRVMLLSVPWDSAYRDVVAWESAEARDAWFAAQTDVAWTDVSFNYLWPNQPVAVPVPFSTAYRYNYIAVTNPAQPVTDEGPVRTYYYFVTDVQYLSPQASNLTVELDVMTTYAEHITFGRAFVDRGHIAMANSNVTSDPAEMTGEMLNDYLSLPEGIDIGSSYQVANQTTLDFLQNVPDNRPKVIFISTADLTASPGNISEPNLDVARGQFADGIPCGCNVYCCYSDDLPTFMALLQRYSWVAQCIIAMYVFPGAFVSNGQKAKFLGASGNYEFYYLGSTDSFNGQSEQLAEVSVFDGVAAGLDGYSDLAKLYTYPYSVIEMTTWTGNPVYLKPQLVDGSTLQMYDMACALMPFARIAVFAKNYGRNHNSSQLQSNYIVINMHGDPQEVLIPNGDFLDSAVYLTDFPQLAIVNNNYYTYLASTVNTRSYSYESAGWRLARANMYAEQAYTNATQGNVMDALGNFMTSAAQKTNAERSLNSGLFTSTSGAAADVIGSLISLNPGQAIGGAFGGMNSAVAANAAYQNAVNTIDTSQALGYLNTISNQVIAGANKDLAKRAAQGDYQNAVAAIDATVQDAALTPPSTVGQMGGNGFNWKNGLFCVTIRWKTICGAALAAVGDYFRRYGYAVRRWLPLGTPAHMLCMSKFAYWRVLESEITCAWANESERETMRGIVEKGVTLWDAPESIGNTDLADNAARAGYSY